MLRFQQHLFGTFFSPQMMSCPVHYDVIYHPLAINSQYLKTWGFDSPGMFVAGANKVEGTKSWCVGTDEIFASHH